MSKHQRGKNVKKVAIINGKKLETDYQAGKKITPKSELSIDKKSQV